MWNPNKFRMFSLALLLMSCGRETAENQQNRAIKVEGKVLDSSINSSRPEALSHDVPMAPVGYQESGESRLLLAIPEIDRLYSDDVVLSSVTVVEVLLYVQELAVNPINLHLVPITQKWGPLVTWQSRNTFPDTEQWNNYGGDFDRERLVTPDVRAVDGSFELSFNVTDLVVENAVNDVPNHGFALLVEKSELNGVQNVAVYTYNSSRSDLRPKAILAFQKLDDLRGVAQ